MTITAEVLDQLAPKLTDTLGDHFPAQARAYDDNERFTLIGAASRTGKTFVAGRKFYKKLMHDLASMDWDDEKLYWCVAPNHTDGIAQKVELLAVIPDWMIDKERQGEKMAFFDQTHGRGTLCLLGGVTIEMKSASNPEGLVARKVRGIWWTEIARSKAAAWPNVYSRLSNYPDSWFIADTSPMGRCWFYIDVWQKALRGEFEDASVHEWKAVDSPYIDAEIIRKARQNLTPELFKREFEASWEAFAGQIYKAWDKSVHMIDEWVYTPHRAVVCCDQNMGSNVDTAMLTMLVHDGYKDGQHAFIEREFYEPLGLDYERYASAIVAEVRRLEALGLPVDVVIDPAALTDFKNLLRAKGIDPINAKNAVKKGIGCLGGALNVRDDGAPRLSVHSSCVNWANEIEGYAWSVSSAGVIAKDTPDPHAVCHLLDCGRYGAMHVFTGWAAPKQIR